MELTAKEIASSYKLRQKKWKRKNGKRVQFCIGFSRNKDKVCFMHFTYKRNSSFPGEVSSYVNLDAIFVLVK